MRETTLQLMTEDEVIARLKAHDESQTAIARELHCSRSFVNQVFKRRTRPTGRMLKMIGVEKHEVYVKAGTFPEELKIPGIGS